ncbi:MAG: SRPBCC family protein, partial [Candidatus Binatia bacterium]
MMTETRSATEPVVRIRRRLPATPQEVFDAWTDPESMKDWMCPGTTTLAAVELDVRIGGKFRIVMRDE